MSDLQDQAIRQHCKALRLPTVGSQFRRLAEAAIREKKSHPGYLEALLAAEMEDQIACLTHPEFAEGWRAQMERRPADFLSVGEGV